MIIIHNATTGKIIERELTDEELEQFAIDQAAQAAAEAEAETKAAARQVILDRLGITADEAALLLG